jgi:WD40 repeat protein
MNSPHRRFEVHTSRVAGLALSFDCVLLASASDATIKLWAFGSRQLLASFDVQYPDELILSPESRQLAYTSPLATKIRIRPINATFHPTSLLSYGLHPVYVFTDATPLLVR